MLLKRALRHYSSAPSAQLPSITALNAIFSAPATRDLLRSNGRRGICVHMKFVSSVFRCVIPVEMTCTRRHCIPRDRWATRVLEFGLEDRTLGSLKVRLLKDRKKKKKKGGGGEEKKKKETRMTASVLKQDPNT